jgi:hypothetical protein
MRQRGRTIPTQNITVEEVGLEKNESFGLQEEHSLSIEAKREFRQRSKSRMERKLK